MNRCCGVTLHACWSHSGARWYVAARTLYNIEARHRDAGTMEALKEQIKQLQKENERRGRNIAARLRGWNGEHTAVDGLVQSISSRTISAEYYQSILILRITRRPSQGSLLLWFAGFD